MTTSSHRSARAHRFHARQGFRQGFRRGFTLVEILVVIAIIAILASILFPVFKRAQEAGRTAVCASNLKQLGLAFTLYANDNAGRLPGGGNFQAWGDGFPGGDPAAAPAMRGGHWIAGKNGSYLAELKDDNADGEFSYKAGTQAYVEQGAIFPYVKSAGTYVCPSNEDGEAKHMTYSMNCAVSGGSVARVRYPQSMVLLIDEWRASDAYFWAENNDASTDTISKDHNEAGNLLFVDGHVKSYPNNSLVLDGSPEGLKNKVAGSTRGAGGNEPASVDTPRFRDVTLGPKGAFSPSPFYTKSTDPKDAKDSCQPQ